MHPGVCINHRIVVFIMDIDLSLILSKALLHVAQVQPKVVNGLQDIILTLLESRVDSSDTRSFVSDTMLNIGASTDDFVRSKQLLTICLTLPHRL